MIFVCYKEVFFEEQSFITHWPQRNRWPPDPLQSEVHLPVAQVNRGVASPPDVSMDTTKLTQILGTKAISFQDGVRSTLDAEAST